MPSCENQVSLYWGHLRTKCRGYVTNSPNSYCVALTVTGLRLNPVWKQRASRRLQHEQTQQRQPQLAAEQANRTVNPCVQIPQQKIAYEIAKP